MVVWWFVVFEFGDEEFEEPGDGEAGCGADGREQCCPGEVWSEGGAKGDEGAAGGA